MFSLCNSLLLLNKYQGEAQASIKTECQAKASIFFLRNIFISDSHKETVLPQRKECFWEFIPGFVHSAAIDLAVQLCKKCLLHIFKQD